jgi:hypothetical protein
VKLKKEIFNLALIENLSIISSNGLDGLEF